MKRKVACALAMLFALMTFSSLSACGVRENSGNSGSNNSNSTDEDSSSLDMDSINSMYDEEEYDENTKAVLSAQAKVDIAPEMEMEYELDADLGEYEYMLLSVKTDVHLHGTLTYVNADDTTNVVTEEFFIEKSDGAEVVEFKQFLDSNRPNGVGQIATINDDGSVDSKRFDKIVKLITFKNVSDGSGSFSLEGLSFSNRRFPRYNRELYIQKNDLKVGADLQVGGTLTYLERTSYYGETVDEVIDQNDNVYIGVNAKANAKEVLSSSVNLINIYDQGRQIQQSYYANVGGVSADTGEEMDALGLRDGDSGPASYQSVPDDYGMNGYERGLCITADSKGYYWPYNPVQGGDCAENSAQIIDFKVTKNEIYVKTRAMDWAKGDFIDPAKQRHFRGTVPGGVTSKSYMENWYTIKSGILFVKNRFIDWNGFENMESVPAHSNELPATYVSHPLHNYVCYTGSYPWNLKEPLEYKTSLGSWAVTSHKNYDPAEDWFAWVNDDELQKDASGNITGGGFGVGMYIPNTDVFVSGRSNATTYKDYNGNSNAYTSALLRPEFKFNKPDAASKYTSAYVGNTSYTAPVVTWTMKAYTEMTYEYAIVVDYVHVMRELFKDIKDYKIITNESLDAWN